MKETKFDVGASAVVQLGENLYKNTYGVLIEYITNSYDADASYVKIDINRSSGTVVIKDDGIGMSLEELTSNFLSVGKNRRRIDKNKTTKKGRLVTGRKGFGKLACFGLFESFKIITVKDGQKSTLIVDSDYATDEEFDYHAMIDEESSPSTEENGTTIYLSKNTKDIVDNSLLAQSIAKRINIMYDGTKSDADGFKIILGDYTIDRAYRDEVALNHDIKFKYEIPQDLKRFTKNKDVIKYITSNKIHGTIIAREKTVRIKENKGVVLFARGKLCQEATFLDINPSNSFGYAHLYAELHVDFIDGENRDNIGTDRTALNDTETTKELFKVIDVLLKAYASIYDEDAKKRDNQAVDEFKEDEIYIGIQKSIDNISDERIRNELIKLLNIKIKSNVKEASIDEADFDGFQILADNVTPTYILNSDQISKDDAKDNITTSYDHLIQYLRTKYSYTDSDGENAFNNIYGQTSGYSKLNSLVNSLPADTPKNINTSLRELGKSIVAMRNAIYHTSNRVCINNNISIENSKRFLIMIDLFIEIDTNFFEVK